MSKSKVYDVPKNHRKHFVPKEKNLDIDIPDGDIIRGQKLYSQHCAGCHDLDQNYLGPSLRDVYNRKMGRKKGFSYSTSMRSSYGARWDRPNLFIFLENPEEMFPDTAMLYSGIHDAYDRACIIEYLHYLKVRTIN